MKRAGQIALRPFPYTNLASNTTRPVLLLRKLNQKQDDWLVCMVSSQLRQLQPDLDWVLTPEDSEFSESGLKVLSVFRLCRIAVLDGSLLIGKLCAIPDARLRDLQQRLANWIVND